MLLAIFLSSLLASTHAAPTVNIGRTAVIGTEFDPARVEFFGGLPFARPPVGQLRLQSPVLTTTINANRFDATNFGPGCLQTALLAADVSEDCLTLNIFRPANTAANARLPVMLWIHGGGFVMGASSLYNGTELVVRSVQRGTPMIFASINYRLGPLGFPQGIEAGQRDILNLGLQDQLVALEWIQANIASFGGDRTKVTVSGESAGASSISIHLLETRIRQLARAAILESSATSPTFDPQRNEASWQAFVAAVPTCASSVGSTTTTFDCLRNATSSSLLTALTTAGIFGNSTSFVPVIDGPGGLLVNRPSQITPRGNLPVLVGTNLDEGALFTPQTISSTEEIEDFLTAAVSPSIISPLVEAVTFAEFLDLYPDDPTVGSPFGTGDDTFGLSSQFKRFAALFGDIVFTSTRRLFTEVMSDLNIPVFAYLFTDPDAVVPPELLTTPPAPGSLGVTHATEIPYVFNMLLNKTPAASTLSITMQDYWISFVSSLTPNDNRGTRRLRWAQYTPNNQVLLELNGQNIQQIPDTFRATGIGAIQDNPDVLQK